MPKTSEIFYIVERIDDIAEAKSKRVRSKSGVCIFIKWEGYSLSDSTWEPIENLNMNNALVMLKGLYRNPKVNTNSRKQILITKAINFVKKRIKKLESKNSIVKRDYENDKFAIPAEPKESQGDDFEVKKNESPPRKKNNFQTIDLSNSSERIKKKKSKQNKSSYDRSVTTDCTLVGTKKLPNTFSNMKDADNEDHLLSDKKLRSLKKKKHKNKAKNPKRGKKIKKMKKKNKHLKKNKKKIKRKTQNGDIISNLISNSIIYKQDNTKASPKKIIEYINPKIKETKSKFVISPMSPSAKNNNDSDIGEKVIINLKKQIDSCEDEDDSIFHVNSLKEDSKSDNDITNTNMFSDLDQKSDIS